MVEYFLLSPQWSSDKCVWLINENKILVKIEKVQTFTFDSPPMIQFTDFMQAIVSPILFLVCLIERWLTVVLFKNIANIIPLLSLDLAAICTCKYLLELCFL